MSVSSDIVNVNAMVQHTANRIQGLHRCEDESIDELAAFLGVGEEVAAMTAKYVW